MRWLIPILAAIAIAFVVEPPVMEAVRTAPEWLTNLAQNVTWIGKTDWQALVLLTVMVASALYRPDPETTVAAERILRLAVAIFLLILLTGIAVQVLKYVFGRPRPAFLGNLPLSTFSPFSFQRGWNAFLSGHATTMGALAVCAIRLAPKSAPIAVAVAAIVAMSRVLVGAHYPADIVAGLALGAGLSMWMMGRWQGAGSLEAPPSPSRITAIPRAFGDLLRALR